MLSGFDALVDQVDDKAENDQNYHFHSNEATLIWSKLKHIRPIISCLWWFVKPRLLKYAAFFGLGAKGLEKFLLLARQLGGRIDYNGHNMGAATF